MRSADAFSIVFIVVAIATAFFFAAVPDAPWYAESVALIAAAIATLLTYIARRLLSTPRRRHCYDDDDAREAERELYERDEARGARAQPLKRDVLDETQVRRALDLARDKRKQPP